MGSNRCLGHSDHHCLVEIPHLVHLGYYRELVVFSLLLLLAAAAGVLKVLGVAMPNPGDWVLAVLSPFGEFLQRLFH